MRHCVTHAELHAALALWNAALALLIEDAKDYVHRGPDRAGYRAAAYQDLTEGGPMTGRVARFCCLDPDEITRQFRSWCEQQGRRAARANRPTKR